MKRIASIAFMLFFCCMLSFAQKYNVVDKTVAVVGNEAIMISDIESEVKNQRAQGMASDRHLRCDILEAIMKNKLFLMQARIDSLTVNQDMVESNIESRISEMMLYLGGEEQLEAYFGKPVYRLRQDLREQFEEMSLIQQEQMEIVGKLPELTPLEVRAFMDTVDKATLPVIPEKYQLSQICLYPDREAANLAVREKLLSLRERILNGEKFSTLARIYSEDRSNSNKGGEIGMASKSIFWPAFSDAAMALKPGMISQIVETPDGFHLIEVIEKKGDMFNARHILIRPTYTSEDREKAFKTLDSLRTEILNEAVTFEMAASFYSQDELTRTNGGQMSDPHTGSAYFEIDQLKPQDYIAIRDLKEGEITKRVQSTDDDGRQDPDKNYINGKENYKIIKVDKIIPAHTATFEDDFNDLKSIVNGMKQNQAIEEFLTGKISQTHIVIDSMFKDCEFKRKDWASKFKED